MNGFNQIGIIKKVGILLISIFLLNGTDLSKKNKSSECPKNFSCLTTYISLGSIIPGLALDLSLIKVDPPKPLDKVTLPLDKNGKFIEVKVDKNVFYYKAFWKEKEILISRFDLDINRSLRTLANKTVQLISEPSQNASILTIIPQNTLLEVIQNTNPLTENVGYVKVKYNDSEGWVKRSSLSDDEYDIRYDKKNLQELVLPYAFFVKDDNLATEFKIIGKGFVVTECKVGELDCSATYRMGESSFGIPEEAVYFDLTVSDGKQYVCEMRRIDFVGELQRVIDEYITENELDPFINCHLREGEKEEEESSEEGS
ncbi:SH3 domain-containing protein [Leptospira biflexa]|uniref:SH3 domain-containing protein n=1 Tax=Leptospira biflexa TaxID=172 RepID=UPI001083BC4A|nr:SH3 domain-containing protein [Leptospira biflexa]TGM35813.1 SH3 domain-containing protein [Leptospira biflexa]TGM37183.1 SH3 domain-containing protein [Leptospira biflexa]